VSTDDHQAVLTVADEGPGIAPEYRERIFDRFFRLDEGRSRDSGGAGLGLAIAKWAVEVNGGHLSMDAGSNGGSVFRIIVPVNNTSAAVSGGTDVTEKTGRPPQRPVHL
jgi:signal transduction histidine kinase